MTPWSTQAPQSSVDSLRLVPDLASGTLKLAPLMITPGGRRRVCTRAFGPDVEEEEDWIQCRRPSRRWTKSPMTINSNSGAAANIKTYSKTRPPRACASSAPTEQATLTTTVSRNSVPSPYW